MRSISTVKHINEDQCDQWLKYPLGLARRLIVSKSIVDTSLIVSYKLLYFTVDNTIQIFTLMNLKIVSKHGKTKKLEKKSVSYE